MELFVRSVIPRVFQQPARTFYTCRSCSQLTNSQRTKVVKPGRISPHRPVPDSIPKPPYVSSSWFGSKMQPWRPKNIELKTQEQVQKMRDSCALAKDVLNNVRESVAVGMTTDALDQIVHDFCVQNGAYPSPLLYKSYPKSVCTSVNNVACHGIPDDRPLEDGDIINVDVTVYYNGYHGDTSATFLIGHVDEPGRHLVNIAEKCRDVGIDVCGPGVPFCEIGNSIQNCADEHGFTVIPHFCGHGIGEYFHGPPDILHFAHNDDGQRMAEGMTFTVEPIISEGGIEILILEDDWTAISADHSRSAQFEHTILITANGVEILTKE